VSLLAGLILVLCGCRTVSTAVIDDRHVLVTTGDLAGRYQPKGLIEVRQTGLMIFGFIPVATGTLQEACDKIIAEARKLDANAIIDLEYKVHKSPFPISFFWWKRGATVKGTAVKILDR
jgi:hypothetical protein